MAEQATTNPCAQPAEALVSRMLDAAAYPHPAADLQMIETHLSWVFLAGEFAYKVRKPVKLTSSIFRRSLRGKSIARRNAASTAASPLRSTLA